MHVFYTDDLDPLLVSVVEPLRRELTDWALIEGFFFVRYWDGGPHLRLRCRPTPGNRHPVEHRVRTQLTRFLHDHPARHQADLRDYAARAAELARQERVTDYRYRPHPTNTVVSVPYRPEHDRYGYGESMAAVERHFQQSSEIVLSWLVTGMSPAERSTAALAVTLLAWFCAGMDPARARRIQAWSGYPDSDVDQLGYDRQRAQLTTLAAKMHALAAHAGDLSGAGDLLTWARSVRSLHDQLAGTLDRAGGRTPFAVIDTCAHLACNRLGVGVDEERHLRYLAARAVAALDRDAPTASTGDHA
jgi:thiopeptide-type bacteriocin biosynthesis protein